MSKYYLFIMTLCASLFPLVVSAQDTTEQVISLEKLFELAEENSKTLKPGITGVSEAEAAIAVAKNVRLPEINLSLSFSYLGDGLLIDRDFSHTITAPMPHFGNNFIFEVSQVIYSGGAINNGIAIAELQKESVTLDLDIVRKRLRFQIVGYYLELFKQENLLRVYEKNIEQTKQVLKEVRTKSDEGILLKNDITRYELLLSNLELSSIQIRNTLTILNGELLTIVGLPQDMILKPDRSMLAEALPQNEQTWEEIALSHSQELKQALLLVEINKKEDKLLRSERLPQIAFVAGNHLDGPITIEVPPINKNFNYWYAGIGVKYNLSSLYKTKKTLNRSKFTIQRNTEQYDYVKEQTDLTIRDSYIRYLEAYEQVETQEKSVELAGQNYDIISNRYKNDMALITDMMDASSSKLQAEVQLVNARINIIYHYYKLKYLSGSL